LEVNVVYIVSDKFLFSVILTLKIRIMKITQAQRKRAKIKLAIQGCSGSV
jgi:hypothetical protein